MVIIPSLYYLAVSYSESFSLKYYIKEQKSLASENSVRAFLKYIQDLNYR